MRAHLKNRAGGAGIKLGHAKTGIEETGVMGAELSDPRVIGAHFGRMVVRHGHEFTACQNVEFVGVKDQPARHQVRGCQPFPIVAYAAACRRVDIHKPGMLARTPADDAGLVI